MTANYKTQQVNSVQINDSSINAIIKHMEKLSKQINLNKLVHVWIAGDTASYYHTRQRMFNTLKVKWSHAVLPPLDMQVFKIKYKNDCIGYKIVLMSGLSEFSESLPPKWESRCTEIAKAGNIMISMIDPNDLVVSKAFRFNAQDQDDICKMVEKGLVNLNTFDIRMNEALETYVNPENFPMNHVRKIKNIIKKEPSDDPTP